MQTKLKPSPKKYIRGVPASKLPTEHFYIKQHPKEELFAYNNSGSRAKPKIRQKCLNELVRRGIKIEWVDVQS